MPLSEQSVNLFLSVINGDLGIMNSKNLFKIQHPFAGKKLGPSTDLHMKLNLKMHPCALSPVYFQGCFGKRVKPSWAGATFAVPRPRGVSAGWAHF